MSACSSLSGKDSSAKKDLGPTKTEQGYYQSAQRSLENAHFDLATKDLESLETYYPIGAYTEQAQLDLMYSRFRNSDYPGAISAADRFIKLYPLNPQIDYAMYVRGVANMEIGSDSLLRYTNLNPAHRDTGYLRAAYDSFRDLVNKYPQSVYTPDAAQRMRFINNQFAESEINVARYYIDRKAYVAAVERASWVVQYYQQTPQIPEALATLVVCYQKLGMDDLANQYLSVIKQNYPKLVHDDNTVNLAEARGEASVLNRMTFGILGRRAEVVAPSALNAPYVPATAGSVPTPAGQPTPPTSTLAKTGEVLSKIGRGVTHWFGSLLSNANQQDDSGDGTASHAVSSSQAASGSPAAPLKAKP